MYPEVLGISVSLTEDIHRESPKIPFRFPPVGDPRGWTVTPQCLSVLHALVKNNLQAVQLLWVMTGIPNMYKRLPVRKLLQSDQPPPYTQIQALGPYNFNSTNQRGRKNRGRGERGHLGRLPNHISPIRPVILPRRPNRRCKRNRPTGRRRRCPHGLSAHQDLHQRNCHTNNHQER